MVDEQLIARGIRNQRLLAVMGKVPRHEFVPESVRDLAYFDHLIEKSPAGERITRDQLPVRFVPLRRAEDFRRE